VRARRDPSKRKAGFVDIAAAFIGNFMQGLTNFIMKSVDFMEGSNADGVFSGAVRPGGKDGSST
jgi:hypothetical protein